MTSNSESTGEDLVPRRKLVELTNHYEAKMKILTEQLSSHEKDAVHPESLPSNGSGDEDNTILKSGVKECCEFIEVHAVNDAIISGFLLWADIQRKQYPENVWKDEAAKKFVSHEITEAKESLWKVSGESLLGKMIKRQGNSKIASELNDICIALRTLSEKDALPMFLGTSLMVSQTPVYQIDSRDKNGDKKLDSIEKSLNSILNEISAKIDPAKTAEGKNKNGVRSGNKQIDTALGDTMTVDDIGQSSSTWSKVDRRRGNKFSQQWKETNKRILPNQTNLVVSGVELGTRSLQIAQYLENKDIEIFDCSLLTTRENATFLTFKITVKKADAEKLKDQSLWLDGWQIRPYNPPNTKKTERGGTGKNKAAENPNDSGKSGMAGQKNNSAPSQVNFSYDRQQFPTLPGNVAVEIPQAVTYNWPYSRTGVMHHGSIVPNGLWNGVPTRNSHGGNLSGNISSSENVPVGFFTPGIAMQDTINVPTSSRLKKVQILDPLGTDVFAQQC